MSFYVYQAIRAQHKGQIKKLYHAKKNIEKDLH